MRVKKCSSESLIQRLTQIGDRTDSQCELWLVMTYERRERCLLVHYSLVLG